MTQPTPRDALGELAELLAQTTGTPTPPAGPTPSPSAPPAAAVDDDDDQGGEAEDAAPKPQFTSLADFVDEHLIHIVERRVHTQSRTSPIKWCARWWAHPEALSRVYALWRAWETLRLDPGTGLSLWWRDHLDPHLAQLTSETGPFARCSPADDRDTAKHHLHGPLPATPIPEAVLREMPD